MQHLCPTDDRQPCVARARHGRCGARLWRRVSIAAALLASLVGLPARAADVAKTIRFIPQADLRILDPVWTTGLITRNHAYMIYDTLFALDERFERRPQMVEEWTTEAGGLVHHFVLRASLKFHDGQPVRAADAVASVKRWMQRDVLGQKLAEAVAEFVADDERRFTLRLARPFPLLLNALSQLNGPFIMPERIAKTDGNTQISDATGSGPFRFVKEEWEPGHKTVYVRNPDYVPRGEAPSWVAGGKVAKVDRVEWIYIPDPATALNALLAGEVDWWQQVPPDLIPVLRGKSGIKVSAPDPLGYIGVLGMNHLHPPFNNAKIRQAVLMALDQRDYMQAAAGPAEFWRTCFSVYTCGTPYASEVGAEALKAPRDLAKARALIQEAGYKGERTVVLDATDYPAAHAEALVTADLLRRLGLNVDLQASDWGTVLTRRTKKGSVDDGGWSIFHTSFDGPGPVDPSTNLALRADGEKAWFGWPTNPRIEALKLQWMYAEEETERQRLAAELQEEAFRFVTVIPLGQFQIPTAWRDTLSGVIPSPVFVMWGVEKR
jgi:peptide/nickel transport system substrate-binding protein